MTPVLIMLPGFMGQSRDFDSLIALLSPGIRCIVLKLPYNCDGTLSFSALVESWFKAQRRELPKEFYLYGYSLGGRLAMAISQYLQQNEPEALKGLMLESAHPGLCSDKERAQRLQQDTDWAGRFRATKTGEQFKQTLLEWYRQPVFCNLSVEQIEKHINSKQALCAKQLGNQLEMLSLGRQANYGDLLSRLKLPVWYFSGKLDRKFTAIGQKLDGVSHYVADDTGHNIHFEKADWLAGQINEILLSLKRKTSSC
ncbi:2-succinyl-6-hydroxy-2,4-cyclohexadiene-1-carboxylate synthase [Alteromonadaceae bacterium Bs31]|nr:2-succinyl-6-hydroxy-2,4-cyclohexadiene-1-carboxylate synthase [Alteromonadaceae bacterium Bs31]